MNILQFKVSCSRASNLNHGPAFNHTITLSECYDEFLLLMAADSHDDARTPSLEVKKL